MAGSGGALSPAAETPTSQVGKWLAWGLDVTSSGSPVANLNNAVAVLEHDPFLQGHVWFDEFLRRLMTTGAEGKPREWTDADDVQLTLYMQRKIGLAKMSVQTVNQAVVAIAYRYTRNSVHEFLDAMPAHDGEQRLEHFFIDVFGAQDTPYTRAAGRNFWIALVARALKPGCKVDNIVVLEGAQGKKKSSALALLVGDAWFAEAQEDITSKDFYVAMQGKWLIEISELDAFGRAEVTTIKRVVSARVDRYRPPYGRTAVDHPRMSLFVATTNKDDWNKDETGARRFWPIRCEGDIRHDLIVALRGQLFAEAVSRFKAGESWWEMPDEDTKAEQAKRLASDVWRDEIEYYLRGKTTTTVSELLKEAVKVELGRAGMSEQIRVGKALTILGWRKVHTRDGNVWVRGSKSKTGQMPLGEQSEYSQDDDSSPEIPF